MGAPPGAASPPPPPMWTPMPAAAARPPPWEMISLAVRLVGFILLFVGVVMVVMAINPGGNCYGNFTSPVCQGNTGWESGQANLALYGKILTVTGLFFVAVGIGLKVHFMLKWPASGRAEEAAFLSADRRANYLWLSVTTILMFLVLWTPVF